MSSESLRESRLRAAYSGRQILPLAATSSRGGVISDLHNPLAPRGGYTKFGNQVGSNPPRSFVSCGKWLCPGSRLFYFLGRTLHSTRIFSKDRGNIPMRLLERVILKCEGSVVLKAIESTECVGDSEKARLGNTTFLELTFPNSGCRGAATLWLFRSETRVNFAFWLEAWSKAMDRCPTFWSQ